jgi:hypothetical protein
VKSAPEWLKQARAMYGARFLAGAETKAEADAAVTAEILAHPEYLAERAAVEAAAHVTAWVKVNASSGDLFQASLFPDIPVLMQVRAAGPMIRTADMTLADLENAKSIVLARTRNSRESADRARKDFTAFYKAVKPHLTEGRTVADALAEIATERSAAELAERATA